jgi:CRISPR-associated protein Cas5t
MGRSLRGIKSNVIKREFLSDVELYLYTDSPEIANALRAPKFQILLGRSGDLARVDSIKEIEIEEKKGLSKVIGTIVPFKKHSNIAAPIQALPMSFTNTIPRRNIGTQPYFIIDGLVDGYKIKKGYRKIDALGFSDKIDEVREWDVYWQEMD